MLRLMVLFFATLLVATGAYAQEFGVCSAEIPYLLREGGMYTKVTAIGQDNIEFKTTYTHEFGSTWSTYDIDWDKLTTPGERSAEVTSALNWMAAETVAVENGLMYYLVVKRGIVFEDPTYTDSTGRTTDWVEVVAYELRGVCTWHSLDWAIFVEDLPEGISSQIKYD